MVDSAHPLRAAQAPNAANTLTPLNVLLADASAAFAGSLADCLSLLPQVRLVGCARRLREALALERHLRPDVVLLDFALDGDMQGLALARRLQADPQPAQLVFVSLHDEPVYAEQAQAVGARHLVSKRHLVRDLIPLLQGFSTARRRQLPTPSRPE